MTVDDSWSCQMEFLIFSFPPDKKKSFPSAHKKPRNIFEEKCIKIMEF